MHKIASKILIPNVKFFIYLFRICTTLAQLASRGKEIAVKMVTGYWKVKKNYHFSPPFCPIPGTVVHFNRCCQNIPQSISHCKRWLCSFIGKRCCARNCSRKGRPSSRQGCGTKLDTASSNVGHVPERCNNVTVLCLVTSLSCPENKICFGTRESKVNQCWKNQVCSCCCKLV